MILDNISREADSDGNLNVLNIERNDDGSWVNNNYANPDNVWNGDNQLVFVRNCVHFSLTRSGSFLLV